jgi:hypothetical protein
MKKRLTVLLIMVSMISLNSCAMFHRPAKCPAYGNVHTKSKKDGSFKQSKTKSNLFPKKMRK